AVVASAVAATAGDGRKIEPPTTTSQTVVERTLRDDVPPATDNEAELTAYAAVEPRCSTRCIPLKNLDLTEEQRRKVDRYLDVTKSALLFGGRILLVEGIAEALLLPVIAQRVVLKAD